MQGRDMFCCSLSNSSRLCNLHICNKQILHYCMFYFWNSWFVWCVLFLFANFILIFEGQLNSNRWLKEKITHRHRSPLYSPTLYVDSIQRQTCYMHNIFSIYSRTEACACKRGLIDIRPLKRIYELLLLTRPLFTFYTTKKSDSHYQNYVGHRHVTMFLWHNLRNVLYNFYFWM